MTFDASSLCEVRVPTFRRPKLLRRALLSILAQTHDNWRCVVFDDCPNRSGQSVVNDVGDFRVIYSHNAKQLGGPGNIDQAFLSKPLLGGKYAFILEDDNFLLPDHMEKSISILEQHNTKVALCNQFCEVVEYPGEPGRIGSGQTLNWMYEPGKHHAHDLLPALLFSHGFSNGTAFWRTDCRTDFQIRKTTALPEIQESLRLLQLKDTVFVSLESTSVWRPREIPRSSAERKLTIARLSHSMSDRIRTLRAMREAIEYQSVVLKRIGVDRVLSFIASNDIPDFARFKEERVARIEQAMLLCGYNKKLTNKGYGYRGGYLLTGIVSRRVMPARLQWSSVKDDRSA